VTASTAKILMSLLPQQGNPALLWARCLRRDHTITQSRLQVSIVGQLCFCLTQQPTPIWRKPFAAAANPDPRALLIFQVGMEEVPLPPDRGDANETDIGVDN